MATKTPGSLTFSSRAMSWWSLFGKSRYGTIIGDNLATATDSKSHNGLIVNGAIRDATGIQQIPGFQIYTRVSILPRSRISC